MPHISIIISKAREHTHAEASPMQERPAIFITLEHDVTEEDFVETARLAFRRLKERGD